MYERNAFLFIFDIGLCLFLRCYYFFSGLISKLVWHSVNFDHAFASVTLVAVIYSLFIYLFLFIFIFSLLIDV